MSFTIDYKPAYMNSIVGQDLIFSVLSSQALNPLLYKYKYFVHIFEGDIGIGTNLVATLKFSCNTDGYGIVNIRSVMEAYCSPDYLGSTQIINTITYSSEFKGVAYERYITPHPIHIIDKFCLNVNTTRNYLVMLGEEYTSTPNGVPVQSIMALSQAGLVFNGISSEHEQKRVNPGDYGVDLSEWNISLNPLETQGEGYIAYLGSGQQKFLTTSHVNVSLSSSNMVYQYLSENDYHTVAFTSGVWEGYANNATYIKVVVYDASDTQIDTFSSDMIPANGGYDGSGDTVMTNCQLQLQYFGCGPANFKGSGVTWLSTWNTYKITLYNSGGSPVGTPYRFKRKDADCKGFETVRLTWLNKFGAWDYFSFTKKNKQSTKIKRAELQYNVGVWDSRGYSKSGYERGRAVLNTAATESIKCISDWFTSDIEAAWIEELFISNDVYILGKYDPLDSAAFGADYGRYLTPVIVTSKKYEKYTQANDKLAQYEVDISYAHNKAVQKA